MTDIKDFARADVLARMPEYSKWCRQIWDYGETAWREYQSAAFYVDLLRREGFDVEEASAGMPTAFCATWSNGNGPTIGAMPNTMASPAIAKRQSRKKPPAQVCLNMPEATQIPTRP